MLAALVVYRHKNLCYFQLNNISKAFLCPLKCIQYQYFTFQSSGREFESENAFNWTIFKTLTGSVIYCRAHNVTCCNYSVCVVWAEDPCPVLINYLSGGVLVFNSTISRHKVNTQGILWWRTAHRLVKVYLLIKPKSSCNIQERHYKKRYPLCGNVIQVHLLEYCT